MSSLLQSKPSSITTSAVFETGKTTRAPASPALTDTDSSECSADSLDHVGGHRHYERSLWRCSRKPKLCRCEVQRHVTEDSCWLVVDQRVYDVTVLLDVHPGGVHSILRKAGGADCTKDMAFHSRRARKMLEVCLVGTLQRCGNDDILSASTSTSASDGCSIM